MDQFAYEGVRFTQAYAAAPVSSPTRASIMTGKYPVNTEITNWIPGRYSYTILESWRKFMPVEFGQKLKLEEKTIAEYLKEQDYLTCAVGKWHLGKDEYFPSNQGFDLEIGVSEMAGPYGNKGYFYPFAIKDVKGREGDFLTDKLTDQTIDWLKENKDSPFFLYFSHYSVHHPWCAPEKDIKHYAKKTKDLNLPDKEKMIRSNEWIDKWADARENQMIRLVQDDSIYAGMVSNLDQNIGRFFDALKEMGLYDNSIIIITSDNGGTSTHDAPTSNLPLRMGKGWLYEGGIRIPTMIKWPGVTKPAVVSDAVINTTDFLPTILEMVGFQGEFPGIDGKSLVPLLKGEEWSEREMYWHYPHYSNEGSNPASAIRKGDYKLVMDYEYGTTELFNLKDDLKEQKDLSKELPEKTEELKQLLESWKAETNAKMPEDNPDYVGF